MTGRSFIFFMFDLAFETKAVLPVLLSGAFLLMDIHLRLDMEVDGRVQYVNENEEMTNT